MSHEPTKLEYERPPSPDDRRFRAADFIHGFICGAALALVCYPCLALLLSLVSTPPAAIIVASTILIVSLQVWIGRDVNAVSEHHGFLLGILLSAPLMPATCLGFWLLSFA